VNDFDHELVWGIRRAAELMLAARYVVALTGAGMSAESNIRPFRGPDGVWTEYGEPPMDGYQRFLADPKREWERMVNREGYVRGMFEAFESAYPNPGHYAMAEMEKLGVLKFVITQNVDNLHRAAGTRGIAEIHGNFRLVRCIDCGARYAQEEIPLDKLPPECPSCGGIIKNDGVYFGEPIPADTLRVCDHEVSRCDCMLLVGTSGFVYPAAGFPYSVKQRGGTLLEVDLYGTSHTPMCDVALKGRSGHVLPRVADEIRARMKG